MITIARDVAGVFNRRFELVLADGARIEAVLYRGDTLCVSSQVGCAVRCPFCASGAHGLGRSLSVEELEAQVAVVMARVVVERPDAALRGVTVSGIGEPLHNHDAVAAFVASVKRRRLRATLTTSGGPTRRLDAWLRALPHDGLTISVHAGTEAVRARMVPHGPDLESLFATIGAALPTLTRARRKKTALAYLAVEGANDGDEEIDAFAARAAPLGLVVHLYAHNPVPTSDARPVDRARYEAIYARLRAAGLVVRMSSQARVEPNGGCGTLVALRRAHPEGAP